MHGFSGGCRGAIPQLSWRILQKIYEKNTEMNVQMPFSGPLSPELGSWPPNFNFLDLPLTTVTALSVSLLTHWSLSVVTTTTLVCKVMFISVGYHELSWIVVVHSVASLYIADTTTLLPSLSQCLYLLEATYCWHSTVISTLLSQYWTHYHQCHTSGSCDLCDIGVVHVHQCDSSII